jgi:molybdenum cofactor biosynthesis protein B
VAGVRCAVLTISDTARARNRRQRRAIVELLEAAGHVVAKRQILATIPRTCTTRCSGRSAASTRSITTGGTGITSRDSTYEAIASLLEKRLDGFGELFRALSYQEIGSAAMLSRACAGVARGTAIFMLPGPRTPSASR